MQVFNQSTIQPLGVWLPDFLHRCVCKDLHSALSVTEKGLKQLQCWSPGDGSRNTVYVDWVLCKAHAEIECKRFIKTTPREGKEKRRNWAERPLKHNVELTKDLLFWNCKNCLLEKLPPGSGHMLSYWLKCHSRRAHYSSTAEQEDLPAPGSQHPTPCSAHWASSSPGLAQESPIE